MRRAGCWTARPRAPRRLRGLCELTTGRQNAPVTGAVGSRASRGSGQSLLGSRGRGALTAEQLASLQAGTFEADTQLEGGDVLMEVLAEDNRRAHRIEFADEELMRRVSEGGRRGVSLAHHFPEEDSKGEKFLPPPRGPRAAQRRYLTHEGVGPGTVFERERSAAHMRLERSLEGAFSYRLPEGAHQAREAARRSRARMRDHDVVESRIEEAIAAGAFENLPGAGRPLKDETNAFELISGEALAHRILKNAGCAPPWVEKGKEIRAGVRAARAAYALQVAELLLARVPTRSVDGPYATYRAAGGGKAPRNIATTGTGAVLPVPAAQGTDDDSPSDEHIAADVASAAAALARDVVVASGHSTAIGSTSGVSRPTIRSWTALRLGVDEDKSAVGLAAVGGVTRNEAAPGRSQILDGDAVSGIPSASIAAEECVDSGKGYELRSTSMQTNGADSSWVARLAGAKGLLAMEEVEEAAEQVATAAEAAEEAARRGDGPAAESEARKAVDAALALCAGRFVPFDEVSTTFVERLGHLNSQIRSYNLVVPSATAQLLALKPAEEKARALRYVCARALELRMTSASREAVRATSKGGGGSRGLGPLDLSGSLSGDWAQAEPVRHGIFASLASVLW